MCSASLDMWNTGLLQNTLKHNDSKLQMKDVVELRKLRLCDLDSGTYRYAHYRKASRFREMNLKQICLTN